MNKLLLFCGSVALLHPLALAQNPDQTGNRNADIYKSVVRIESATQVADYRTPWNSGRFGTAACALLIQSRGDPSLSGFMPSCPI